MNRKVWQLASILLLTACANKHNVNPESGGTINLNSIDSTTIGELVDSVTFMPLVENNGQLVGGVGKMRFYNGKIYIGDSQRHQQKRIFVYNQADGSPCFVVDALGPGPQEYLEIRNFTVDERGIAIIDNYRQKMVIYDADNGAYKQTLDMPFFADDVEALGNGDYLFALVPQPRRHFGMAVDNDLHRIYRTDSALNVVKANLPVGEDVDPLGMLRAVSRNGDEITFATVMTDGYYTYNQEADSMAMTRIPFENGLAGKPDVSFDEMQNYQHLNDAPLPVGNLIYFTYADGHGMIQARMWRKGGETVFQQSDSKGPKHIYWNIVGADGNKLVSYIDDPQAYDAMVENGFEHMPADVEKHLYNEGGVLMFYHMKQ